MFYLEAGAMDLVNAVTERYEKQFKEEFPFHEYLDMGLNEDGTLTVAGAQRMAEFIERRIEAGQPVIFQKGTVNGCINPVEVAVMPDFIIEVRFNGRTARFWGTVV